MRYEDLASNTSSVLRHLYNHLGLAYTDQVEQAVCRHIHGVGGGNHYYSTTRGENFTFNSWQKTMSLAKIRDVEAGCRQLMDLVGYRRFQPQTEN